MHNPIGFPAVRGTALVEDEGLPHANDSVL